MLEGGGVKGIGLVPFGGRIPLPGARHLEALIATAIVGRDLTDDDKHHLRRQGRNAAQAFLRGWDWEAYLGERRTPPAPAAVDP